jgi:UDP-2,4-diacetamido-2,4,6-trideoxy-beta-L-altropyranose hydrolase
MTQTLLIRADASTEMGSGHAMRCLAISQAWKDRGGKTIFISRCESEAIRQRLITEGMDFIPLEKSHPDASDLECTIGTLDEISRQHLGNETWLIVDGYHFDASYQKRIKEGGHKLLWIDDYGHADHYWADIVLNHNTTAKDTFYQSREPYTRLLLGSKYVLLRKEFWPWKGWRREIAPVAKKILVTMGGADPENATLKVVRPSYPHYEALQNAAQATSLNIEILKDVKDMSELMVWADIAIAAGGGTCWELAFMGLPSLLFILADNQLDVASQLSKDRIAITIGYHEKITIACLSNKIKKFLNEYRTRLLLSSNGGSLIDGFGPSRICCILSPSEINLRPVIQEDCERIWNWANDPSVRAISFSKSFIDWDEHVHWFKNRKNLPSFYLALSPDNIPLGQVRVEQINNEAVISMMIDKDFRNRGYGVKLIINACAKVFQSSEIKEIHAYIETDNKLSFKTFIKAGFKETVNRNIKKKAVTHLILSKKHSDC